MSKEDVFSWQLKSLDPLLQSKYSSWRNVFPTANFKCQENKVVKHRNKAHTPFPQPCKLTSHRRRSGPTETWPGRSASPLQARGHCCHPQPAQPWAHDFNGIRIPTERSFALPNSPGTHRIGITQTALPSPCQPNMGKSQHCLQLQEYWWRVWVWTYELW